MKSIETLKLELSTLHNDYLKNPLPAGSRYNAFAKKYKGLQSKIKNYDGSTAIMNRAGLTSKKDGSGYLITYKGIQANIFLDGCETDYWAIHIETENFEMEFQQYDSKSEAIWILFQEINSQLN